MNGIRAFAAYLGLVWFFLGFANFLTLMDRVKESFEQPGAAEAVELRLEGAEKALEVAEKEWEAKLEITDQNLEKIEKESRCTMRLKTSSIGSSLKLSWLASRRCEWVKKS